MSSASSGVVDLFNRLLHHPQVLGPVLVGE
jgi:hypothetical protein